MTSLVQAFNTHFMDFIEDVQSVFPEDPDILTAKNYIILAKKTNPTIIIKMWKMYICNKYKDEILAGNLSFFLEKDYSVDVENVSNSDKIMDSINRLRDPIQKMSSENQLKSMKYIQNLTKIANIYENS